MANLPDLVDIQEAHHRIKKYIHKTPVMTSRQLNERVEAEVFFKCENFQRVGAFKFRGGSNAIFSLTEAEAQRGVTTHSSGNHAQAIALAANMRGIRAIIVMPENAPKVKVNAVKGYGAEIRFCEPTLEAREATAKQVIEESGAVFIHPYNDRRIIAGQGTAALEFFQQQPDLNVIMAPIGGGGLMSGTAVAAKKLSGDTLAIGVEPEAADDAYQSFKQGKLIPVQHPDTVADGLRTSLGELTFQTIRKYVDDIVTVSESTIIQAMRFIWERMKIIVEPSSAVPLAALFEKKLEVENKKIGIILSGGNVDLESLPWL